MNINEPTARYDQTQVYEEWLRSQVGIYLGLAIATTCLVGVVAVKAPTQKLAFTLTGLLGGIVGRYSLYTKEERGRILDDIKDIGSAARTNDLYLDMSPNMGYQTQPIEMPVSAINTGREMRRAVWLKAKEARQAGKPQFEIIKQDWGYSGSRYPVGQQEWAKLEVEFGSINGEAEPPE